MTLGASVPADATPATLEPAVALRDVFCVHRTSAGDAAALQGLNLRVPAGERLCVLGPSGAGKTTLLRVIAGLQEPSAGSVLVFGRDPGRLPARDRARLRHESVGFLDQHAETVLSPDLTVAQNIALPLALRGVSREDRRARVTELLKATGLADRAASLPASLSGGERQRVALSAALAHRPRLLLADEPTAELDRSSARSISELIGRLAQDNETTVILVSHDAELADHAQRVVRIRDGRVVAEGIGGRGRLVVDRGGWVQLPAELLDQAGIDGAAHVEPVPGGLLLTPARAAVRRDVRAPSAPVAAPPTASGDPAAALGDPATAPGAPATIELRGVGCERGQGRSRRAVLKDFTACFAPGELTAVTGRSGSGKTTLLELLAGLRSPDSGELVLDGRVISALGREARATVRRQRIGYLPQEPAPIGFLSARENLTLALRVRGQADWSTEARVDAILAQLGLEDRADQRVERLSAGEAQRVALARAVACARGLLIVDEPTSRLDEHTAALVAGVLRGLTAHGQSLICATHDEALAALADRVIVLPER
jgi:energy-coupling factor transport system ATP-binding protein